jgi:hypothetical protein
VRISEHFAHLHAQIGRYARQPLGTEGVELVQNLRAAAEAVERRECDREMNLMPGPGGLAWSRFVPCFMMDTRANNRTLGSRLANRMLVWGLNSDRHWEPVLR